MPKNKIPLINPNILILEGLWSDTADAVRAAGGLPTEASPWDYVEVTDELLSGTYDGLLLTGGSDINPKLYGEKPEPEVYGIDDLRDVVELRALEIAKDIGIPVLGICRGSQIMTAFRGGKLVQHIGEGHRGGKHWVAAAPDAKTFRRAAACREMAVVSLHHQCVRRPGKGMRIAAVAGDGTVEAVESKDGLWLGCQFHPEINAFESSNSYAIFSWLVSEAAKFAGGRPPFRPFRDRFDHKYERYPIIPSTNVAGTVPTPNGETLLITSESESTKASPPRKPRKAGDPAIPSMRDMTAIVQKSLRRKYSQPVVIEGTAFPLEDPNELDICPECAMLFDEREDRNDHVRFVHGITDFEDAETFAVPFARVEDRYPELEPPPGHEAWTDDDVFGTPMGEEDPEGGTFFKADRIA